MSSSKKPKLEKAELQDFLIGQKFKIGRLISQFKKRPKEIKFYANLYGEYMLSTRGKKFIPKDQRDSNIWHYDVTVKTKDKNADWIRIASKNLREAIHNNIEKTYWYF